MRLGFTTPTPPAPPASIGLPPEVRTNLLLAALPLGLALLARGVNELDKIIQGRQNRLLRLEGLIRHAEHQLRALGVVDEASFAAAVACEHVGCEDRGPHEHGGGVDAAAAS